MSFKNITQELQSKGNPDKAKFLQRFFKTGKGEYAEGDVFLGINVPVQRTIAKSYYSLLSLEEISELLQNSIHEYRLTALIMLTLKFDKAKFMNEKKTIVDFYIAHRNWINNWDLVDTSTHKILGNWVHQTHDFELLFQLANEENLWSKRIAVVAFWILWKKGHIEEGLEMIKLNLTHPHDLMHKANGWMLRELGKIDELSMLQFIQENYAEIPRTTLRYAIEKLPPEERLNYLKGTF